MCLFCDFITGKINNHLNGFPFLKILETSKILVFLGIPENCAESKKSDILIIPKQHFEFIEDMPKEILSDLINEVSNMAEILREKYGSCKIFLNNGSSAGQYIPHVHFHLAPINDKKEHVFQKLNLEEFKAISFQIKELLSFKKL